jgi:hypothetical protein
MSAKIREVRSVDTGGGGGGGGGGGSQDVGTTPAVIWLTDPEPPSEKTTEVASSSNSAILPPSLASISKFIDSERQNLTSHLVDAPLSLLITSTALESTVVRSSIADRTAELAASTLISALWAVPRLILNVPEIA